MHHYREQVNNNATIVIDEATNLIWQKDGSKDDVTYEEAKEYI